VHIAISSHDDEQLALVERYLDSPFVTICTRDILEGNALSYQLHNGQTHISAHGQPLTDVHSVWYKQFLLVQGVELPVSEGKRKFAQDAIKYFNWLLFSQFADAFWLSRFFAIERANDKFLQLQTAARVGFNVPDTIITASPEEAKAFVADHKSAIAKPNYSARYREEDGKEFVFYTSRINTSTDFSGLRVAPAILQQAIEVKTELRITVVGTQVFAAAIDSDTSKLPSHIRDWRVADTSTDVHITVYELPEAMQKKCVAVVKELGLEYGAIDAIIDKQDKLWFLENNPQGQWTFIQKATGMPIAKAIADLLMGDTQRRKHV
jgi:glutathione synthase/RimK-type ligase-like ATP-grasp enzyme